MTDFELNKAIADKLGVNYHIFKGCLFIDDGSGGLPQPIISYTNSWDDLMPLVEFDYEMKKTVNDKFHCSVMWDFNIGDPVICTFNAVETKQRALAECLLKVLDDLRASKQHLTNYVI